LGGGLSTEPHRTALYSQAEVDAFPQDCDSVASSINVGGVPFRFNDITNLSGLAKRTSVGRFEYLLQYLLLQLPRYRTHIRLAEWATR
jgi:hypothetical protein